MAAVTGCHSKQIFIMIKTFTDIPGVTDKDTHGKRIYHKVHLLLESDVDMSKLPAITEDARTCEGFALKAGATGWKGFSFVRNTIENTSEGSRGDITSTVNNTLTGTLGGDRKEIDTFIENHQGDNFFIVYVDIYSGKKRLLGRPYCPMQLTSFTRRNGKDNTSCDVTFTNESFFQPLEYLGDLPFEAADDGNI